MKKLIVLSSVLLLTACAGSGIKRVVIDESADRPSWVDEQRLSYEDDDRIYFISRQAVKGSDRIHACYQIAGNDGREAMLREIADNLKGQTDEVEGGISENAEILLGKVRSGEWSGRLTGFKEEERYFQRIQFRDAEAKSVVERQECAVLSSISKTDYARTKNEVLNKVISIEKRVKDAVAEKQASFFNSQQREPASVTPAVDGQ